MEAIKDVPGDIVECGVGGVRSLLILSALNHFLTDEEGNKRTIYAYDSFEGFPEPTQEDESKRNPKKGEWSQSPGGHYQYSIEYTKLVLSEAGIPLDDYPLHITKGFFCDSLKHHPKRPIALLHVDSDLYQSYKDTLENLYDLVAKGGVIVFDDFFAEPKVDESFPGSRLAVKEFLGDQFNNLKVSVGGTYYYVKE